VHSPGRGGEVAPLTPEALAYCSNGGTWRPFAGKCGRVASKRPDTGRRQTSRNHELDIMADRGSATTWASGVACVTPENYTFDSDMANCANVFSHASEESRNIFDRLKWVRLWISQCCKLFLGLGSH
jgi:hypothetical protein